MHSPLQNANPPVPKPRTRFNCGRLDDGRTPEINGNDELEVDTTSTVQQAVGPIRVPFYPTLNNSPASPGIPPPKPPRESPTNDLPPPRPPPPAGWNLNPTPRVAPAPPSSGSSSSSSSPPSRTAPPPPTSEFQADKPVPPIPPRPLHLHNVVPLDSVEHVETQRKPSLSVGSVNPKEISPNYIENAAYMTLTSYRDLAVSSSNESGFYSNMRSPPLPVCDSKWTSETSETEEEEAEGAAMTTTESYNGDLAAELAPRNLLDLKPRAPSGMTASRKSFNDYTPPPKRDDYAFASEFASVIDDDVTTERAEITLNESRDDILEAEGVSVSFFGYVQIHIGKKEKKRAHARLKDMHLSFHDDEEAEDYLCGPFHLTGCQMISRNGSTISIRLNELENQKHLTFSVEEARDNWSLILSECWLTQYELLRSSATGMSSCGTFFIRQGTASDWQTAAGGLLGRTLYYIVLESMDCIYELDIRKVLSIREKVEKDQWCPLVRKKSHRGPFILVLEGCSLYIECEDEWSTNLWHEVIDEVLMRQATTLDEYRLTGDNVPIIVDKCIRFVSAYGMSSEGIYRRNGKISEAKDILAKLNKDAPGVHLKPTTDETVYAVADVLRQFFRRLTLPLICHDIQSTLFSIVNNEGDDAAKAADMSHCLLQGLPQVHFNTLKKLMAHLSDVSSHAAENRASVENLAKVFGASLFHTETEEGPCFVENSNQISVVAMLINHYDRIFEPTSREELSRVLIEEAQKIKTPQHKAVRTDGLLVPIHIWERDNCAFNVKTTLAAEEVCREAVVKRGFDADIDDKYAIYEIVRGGALKRRLFDSERLSEVVINRWIPWKCHDGYLLFDRDRAVSIGPDNMSCYSGKVKVAEPGSKSFKSMELKIDEGEKVVAYKGEKKWKEWQLEKTVWFMGSEHSRKAPYSFSATFFAENSNLLDKHPGFCVSFRTASEQTHFLNQINCIQQASRPAPLVHI